MAGAIRLTKAERAFIRGVLEWDHKDSKVAQSILEKLEHSELVKGKGRPPGMGYQDIMGVLGGVLGDRLVPPMGAYIGMMVKRVQLLGLARDDLEAISLEAMRQWKGRIKADSIVRNAEKLLADARADYPAHEAPQARAPLGMD